MGFSPRMHASDVDTGALRYLNWQFTWWSGVYSIMLTKASLLHRDYLYAYDKVVPGAMLQHIDSVRNCEDIAMAYVVALQVPHCVYIVNYLSHTHTHCDYVCVVCAAVVGRACVDQGADLRDVHGRHQQRQVALQGQVCSTILKISHVCNVEMLCDLFSFSPEVNVCPL